VTLALLDDSKKTLLTESYGELIIVHVDEVSNLKTCSNQIFALLEQERP
jgi:hypothetical protein